MLTPSPKQLTFGHRGRGHSSTPAGARPPCFVTSPRFPSKPHPPPSALLLTRAYLVRWGTARPCLLVSRTCIGRGQYYIPHPHSRLEALLWDARLLGPIGARRVYNHRASAALLTAGHQATRLATPTFAHAALKCSNTSTVFILETNSGSMMVLNDKRASTRTLGCGRGAAASKHTSPPTAQRTTRCSRRGSAAARRPRSPR